MYHNVQNTVCEIPMALFQIKPDQGRIEKWILRKAFDDEEHPYLPKVVSNIYFLFEFI